MTNLDAPVLTGLPAAVSELLASPPLAEKKLLEMALRWEALPPEQAAMADMLRLFVVTWDPIEWRAPRPEAIATANARPDEIVVYTPIWSATALAERQGTTLKAVFTELAGSAIVTAAENAGAVKFGGYPTMAAHGKVPDLLSARGTEAASALGQPDVVAVSTEWEDIGLGAITDFAQHVHGNVSFDRSLVTLTARGTGPRCPACRGLSFGFPADLNDTAKFMCAPHQDEVRTVTRSRIAVAEKSNRAGWRMIIDASTRSTKPHLPGGLATRLAATGLDRTQATPDDLVARAQIVAEAAKWFPARPDEFGEALYRGRERQYTFPRWLASLILDLGRAGKPAEATVVSEALVAIHPGMRDVYEGEAKIAVMEAEIVQLSAQSPRPGASPAQTQRRQPRAKASKAQRKTKR